MESSFLLLRHPKYCFPDGIGGKDLKNILVLTYCKKGLIHFTSNFVYLWFYLKYICFPVAASTDKKSMKDREMFLKKMVLYSMMTLWKVMEIYSRLGGS